MPDLNGLGLCQTRRDLDSTRFEWVMVVQYLKGLWLCQIVMG